MDDIFYINHRKLELREVFELGLQFYSGDGDFNLFLTKDESAFQVRRRNRSFLDAFALENRDQKSEALGGSDDGSVFCFSFHRYEISALITFLTFVLEKFGGQFGMDDDNFEPRFDQENILGLIDLLA